MKPYQAMILLSLTSCATLQYRWYAPMDERRGIPNMAPSTPICMDFRTVSGVMRSRIDRAYKEWNRLLGHVMFVPDTECSIAIRSVVRFIETRDKRPLTKISPSWTFHNRDKASITQVREVYLSRLLNSMVYPFSHNIIMHQLGHVLGLANSTHCDNYMSSPIICPVKYKHWERKRLNNLQIERLQRLYGIGRYSYTWE